MQNLMLWLFLPLAMLLDGCGPDLDHERTQNVPVKPSINMRNDETIRRSLYELVRSGGSESDKAQILLGMERLAIISVNDEKWLAQLRAQKGLAPTQPLLNTFAIAQMIQQDARVRKALLNKTVEDFLSAGKLARSTHDPE